VSNLFKYVSLDTGRNILKDRTLRWASPATLNDPFDMQFALQVRIDRAAARALQKSWQHFSGKLLDRPLNALGEAIRELRTAVPSPSHQEFDQEMGHRSFEGGGRVWVFDPVIDQEITANQLAALPNAVRDKCFPGVS